MTTKQQILAEIERMLDDTSMYRNLDQRTGGSVALARLHTFLDTLPDESEQPTRGYDEAYLNEKIAKASKSWKGVDVNKFMDEVKGREPVTDCNDLTEAAENSWAVYEYRESPKGLYSTCYVDGFKAGAEWMKKQMPMPEDTVLFQKGVEEGKRLMMEGAVEGEVCGRCYGHLNIRFVDGVYKGLEPKNISHIPADVSKYNIGDKVKIIIVKEKEQ